MKKQKFNICYYVFKFYNLKWVILSKTMYNEQIKTTAVLKILVFWSSMLFYISFRIAKMIEFLIHFL